MYAIRCNYDDFLLRRLLSQEAARYIYIYIYVNSLFPYVFLPIG